MPYGSWVNASLSGLPKTSAIWKRCEKWVRERIRSKPQCSLTLLVDPKSVGIILNRHGVTAMGPHHTDMLDIDLSTNFKLGAVYHEASHGSSASLPNGYYTLGPSQPAEGRGSSSLTLLKCSSHMSRQP